MCIAIYKPAGKKMPAKSNFKNCFSNNGDGAGYMYSYNGKVYIEKGLMTLSDFKKSLKNTFKSLKIKDNGESLHMVFHFRISTQGGVQPELTHPFPLSNDYDDMKKLSNVCDIGIAHNGIIDFASSYSVKDHNDTMEFIKEIAYPQIGGNTMYFKNQDTMSLFKYLLKNNKIVILNGDGHAELIGDWVEDNGVFYSNTTYKQEKTSFKVFKTYGDYCSYYGSYYGYEKPKQLSKSQLADIKTSKTIFCDFCGEECVIQYDDDLQCYIAICLGCGQTYELDEKTAEFALQNGLCDYPYYDDDEHEYYSQYGVLADSKN